LDIVFNPFGGINNPYQVGNRWRYAAAALVLVIVVAGSTPAAAEVVDGLYRGEAIVTGQENLPERERGFREALAEVLVKASGDDRLAYDPRLAPVLAHADTYVAGFDYEDRLAKKKLMDEQGTRERSYFLRVSFDPQAVDRALARLGKRPWPADRPRLLVLLGIRDTVGPYLLETASPRGYRQREALAAAARRRGVPVTLPESGTAGSPEAAFDQVARLDADMTERMRLASAVDAVLLGTMVMTPEGVWDTRWTLLRRGDAPGWTVPGTTFDRAIGAGIGGAARIMAGLD
jgi:hypothetical protein